MDFYWWRGRVIDFVVKWKVKGKKKGSLLMNVEEKSPAPCLSRASLNSISIIDVLWMNRNEDERKRRTCLCCCYYIDYWRKWGMNECGRRLCRLIICVFFIQMNDLNRWSFSKDVLLMMIISRCIDAKLTICFATFLLLLEQNTIAERLFSRYRAFIILSF